MDTYGVGKLFELLALPVLLRQSRARYVLVPSVVAMPTKQTLLNTLSTIKTLQVVKSCIWLSSNEKKVN